MGAARRRLFFALPPFRFEPVPLQVGFCLGLLGEDAGLFLLPVPADDDRVADSLNPPDILPSFPDRIIVNRLSGGFVYHFHVQHPF